MGQYYFPVLSRDGKKTFTSYRAKDLGGLKLMEHSWWCNNLTCAISKKIYKKPQHVWWCGDYAVDRLYDKEKDEYYVDPETEEPLKTVYDVAWGEHREPKRVTSDFTLDGKFLCNHTKKIYMDCDEYFNAPQNKSWENWVIHPLPLLTAVGNGQGGGDYWSEEGKSDVGSWAGDKISVRDVPIKGYKKVFYNFVER